MEKGSNYRRNTYRAAAKNQPRNVGNAPLEAREEEQEVLEDKKSDFKFESFLQSYKLQMSLGIFLIGISLFMFLSLISYLFSGMADQSVVEAMQFKDIFSPTEKVENWLGIAGAGIAHFFIYHLIGVPSLLIVPIFFTTGYELISKKRLVDFNTIFVYTFFFTAWISLLLGYIVAGSDEPSTLAFMCGGVGLACAEALNNAFGGGTIIVLIVSLCIFVVNIVSLETLFQWVDQLREQIEPYLARFQKKEEISNEEYSEEFEEETYNNTQFHNQGIQEQQNDFGNQFSEPQNDFVEDDYSESVAAFDDEDNWETVIKEEEQIVEDEPKDTIAQQVVSTSIEEEPIIESKPTEVRKEVIEPKTTYQEPVQKEEPKPIKTEKKEVLPEPKVIPFKPKLEVVKKEEKKAEPQKSLYHQALRTNVPDEPLDYRKDTTEEKNTVAEKDEKASDFVPEVVALPEPEVLISKEQLPYPEAEEEKVVTTPKVQEEKTDTIERKAEKVEIQSHGLMPVSEEPEFQKEEPKPLAEEPKPVQEVVKTTAVVPSQVPQIPQPQQQVEEEEPAELEVEYEEVEEKVVSKSTMSVQHTDDVDRADVSSLHQGEQLIIEDSSYYDPHLDLPHYKYPDIDLLHDTAIEDIDVSEDELEENKMRIMQTLHHFKIEVDTISAVIGPTVTLYEIVPERGVKVSKIKSLEDDIALSLAAIGIRIIAPIPGKGTIGIEVPNKNRKMVSIRSVLATSKFMENDMSLPVALGRTISNEVYIADLAKMPHLLMAGATGQGKSVGINVLLASLLYKKHPSELKFVMIDPKKVELSIFNKIEKQFLASLPDAEEAIITDTSQAIHVLNSLCREMDSRYDLLKNAKCRNLKEYNKKFQDRRLNPNKGHRYLPFIVLFIDELADLMMTADKDIELPIARLAQLARAIGIHLVVATQRPSVDVITGKIKANFPARLSFRVSSKIDSRTILDNPGAEQLVGMGDMLYYSGNEMTRLQCAFIDTEEVEGLCDFIGEQKGYDTAYLLPEFEEEQKSSGGVAGLDMRERDALFEDAARLIILTQQGSTSLIQRKLSLGYNRAGRIMDQLEAAGIVGPNEGSKARQVLIPDEFTFNQLLEDL
ncbi:DNA translocase FtsK 4TM domain-containing protein [Sediminitomix flava]|uniref:DNA segregation ATPase FtsK/SpoIIIE-like protein n=1 Tax=Sediminitomix flava TaxID=379075 RepID=A0A316A325_SEDFL|nr:DNA translocase FtsK 4TM domain-containing protein [Sediminitomix flava]PWJ44107.1 DNA segregation ATPase FtsK/SpoIIIE-like protein [Sediminitomix flava]